MTVTSPDTTPKTPMAAHPWTALTGILIGLSMIVIDGSVVNVLLPDMVDELGLTNTDVLWVNSIYSLIFASLLIPIGLIADRYGRKRLFLIGTVVFLLGSFGAGASTSPGMLIAFRAVQAVGASMMLPSSVAIINVMFVGKQRAAAFGLWGAVFGGAAALGPLLGGFLGQEFSWRWAFFINVPVAIISAILVIKYVPETKAKGSDSLDPVGVLLSVFGLALIVFGLIESEQYGWWNSLRPFEALSFTYSGRLSIVPIAVVTGMALLLCLFFWSRYRARIGKTPLIDLELFSIPRYGFGNVVALVVSLGEFGILFVLPLWLQSVAGLGILQTGVLLTALAGGALLSGGAARHLAAAVGPTRTVRLGMGLEIIGILGTALVLSPSRSPWWMAIPLFIYGIGLGLASAQLTSVVLEDVPPAKSGRASAMTSTFRQLGSALGSAILGATLFAGLGYFTTQDLASTSNLPQEQQQALVQQIKGSSGQIIPKLEEIPEYAPEVAAAKDGYTRAAKETAYLAAIFVFFGLLVSLGLPKDEPGDPADATDDGVPDRPVGDLEEPSTTSA
jgi:EmrB/QacA subfamily drug resistance transporter